MGKARSRRTFFNGAGLMPGFVSASFCLPPPHTHTQIHAGPHLTTVRLEQGRPLLPNSACLCLPPFNRGFILFFLSFLSLGSLALILTYLVALESYLWPYGCWGNEGVEPCWVERHRTFPSITLRPLSTTQGDPWRGKGCVCVSFKSSAAPLSWTKRRRFLGP